MKLHTSSHNTHTKEVFRFPCRVYFEDTDAGGIAYHANFLHFTERARTEWLRAKGLNHHDLRKDHGLMLVVRHIEIDYRAPALLDDLLEVTSEVEAIGNTSFTLRQVILRDKILAEMKVVIVAITLEGKASRLPPQLRQIFSSHQS